MGGLFHASLVPTFQDGRMLMLLSRTGRTSMFYLDDKRDGATGAQITWITCNCFVATASEPKEEIGHRNT